MHICELVVRTVCVCMCVTSVIVYARRAVIYPFLVDGAYCYKGTMRRAASVVLSVK